MPQRILDQKWSSLLLRYYFGPDHPFKLRLWSWGMAALGHPRFTVPFRGGWITLDPRDWIQNEVLAHGKFDEDVWEALDQYAVANEVFWDVGAHVGTVTVRALNDPRFRQVHAFEPHPETFASLKTNVQINGEKGIAHATALSDTCGLQTFYNGLANNTGLASLIPRWGTSTIQVQSTTADRCVAEGIPTPTLMKIDTEGAEWSVLAGATEILKMHPPKAIVFESEHLGGKIQDAKIIDYLEALQFQVRPLVPPGSEHGCINWIATPKK